MKTHRLFELRVSMNNDNSLKQISQHERNNFPSKSTWAIARMFYVKHRPAIGAAIRKITFGQIRI